MILVILETPYAADTEAGIQENIDFARACMRACLLRGEAPLASHLLYTQPGVLDDKIPEERSLGIDAGLLWGQFAKKTVMYLDRGISRGMRYGIENAKKMNRPVETRYLDESKNGKLSD